MKKEKLRIALVGCGQFCRNFVPLFRDHPAVEYVAVCDKFRNRAEDFQTTYGVGRVIDTFDDVLAADDINAVAIFTQRDLHGDMAMRSLMAGKHVYSAVPMSLKAEDILEIVRLVKETGLTYSMGETGVYRPAAIFCRKKFASGEMGDMVYAEAQYNHDMKRLYHVFQNTEGDKWRLMAGLPPMLYPTHSTSMVLSSANTHAVKVAAFGMEDRYDTDIFGKGKNYWDNPFSNTSMLLKLNNGAIARISENRRIAWHFPETYLSSFNGTKASYECSLAQHSYVQMKEDGLVDFTDVSDLLNPTELTAHKHDIDFMKQISNNKWSRGEAPIQMTARLPKEFVSLHTGHGGTHKFMVDDFCQAYATGKLSPTNAWTAARYNLPGLIAHQSALNGGATMDIPDLGDPPAHLEVLSLDRTENEDDYR